MNEDKWEAQQIEKWDYLLVLIKNVWWDHPYEDIKESKNVKQLILINVQKKIDRPFFSQGI